MVNSKPLTISLVICGIFAVFILAYVSSYTSKAPVPATAGGITRDDCADKDGNWGWTSSYSTSGEKVKIYHCY